MIFMISLCSHHNSSLHKMFQYFRYIYWPVTPRAQWEATEAMANTFEEINLFCSVGLSLSFHTLPPTSVVGFGSTEALCLCWSSTYSLHLYHLFQQNKEWVSVERGGIKLLSEGCKESLSTRKHQRWPTVESILSWSRSSRYESSELSETGQFISEAHIKMNFRKGFCQHEQTMIRFHTVSRSSIICTAWLKPALNQWPLKKDSVEIKSGSSKNLVMATANR